MADRDGTDGADDIEGTLENDRLRGLGGDDVLVGLRGDDVLKGGGGDDTLVGGAGNDRLIGGGGSFDWASYGSDPAAIRADLAAGTVQDGYGGTDRLRGIERVIGSDFADVMLGGGPGPESYEGGLGDDLIDGKGGIDRAVYRNAPSGVTVDLAAGFARGGDGSDRLVGIEEVIGSELDDRLLGAATDDYLAGFRGDDVLTGRGGADLLWGAEGDDRLKGGAGDDTLDGDVGADRMNGGGGADTFLYYKASDSAVDPAGRDLIRGFDPTRGDRIDLSELRQSLGIDQFFFITGTFDDEGEVRAEVEGDLTIIEINLDLDGVPEMAIALSGAPLIDGSAFVA